MESKRPMAIWDAMDTLWELNVRLEKSRTSGTCLDDEKFRGMLYSNSNMECCGLIRADSGNNDVCGLISFLHCSFKVVPCVLLLRNPRRRILRAAVGN